MATGRVIAVGGGDRPLRRRALAARAAPILVLALAAFVVGIIVGSGGGDAEKNMAQRYVTAWSHGDMAKMYSLLSRASREQISLSQFESQLVQAEATSTFSSLRLQGASDPDGSVVPVRVRVRTRIFGTLPEVLRVHVHSGESASADGVDFTPELLFPGLRSGETLSRQVSLPPRADILAADGTPLARGAQRSSPIPDVAGQIAGTVGAIPAKDALGYQSLGYPPDAKVGLDGLERVFQGRLAGRPGGTLLAGHRVLARTTPLPGQPVTSTIVPALERAAVSAMAGRYAGIAVMDPHTGGLMALAGVAFSALQPPGSTMKIVTATGALEARIVKLSDTFPIATSADVGGFNLHNAGGEACGGTFLNAFAVSCNSVFAPLGVKLGGKRLVDIAQRFGFNETPSIPGAAEPTIPSAAKIGDDLAVGTSAIGQGQVQSTALGMTDIAATIAMGGRRPIPTLLAHQPPRFVPVVAPPVAHQVEQMMVAVVKYGTGTPAQIPGVEVAGKTGTAELRDTTAPGVDSFTSTDSWFVGYGPVGAPRVVVGALFPEQGAGAQTAAPAVHDVLAAALSHH